MYINQIFELTIVLGNEKFQKVLNRACSKADYLEESDGEFTDLSFVSKGITVRYRNSQYKKKVKMSINIKLILDDNDLDSDKFIRKLDKRIREYFDCKYQMNDFVLSGVVFATDIDVGNYENVAAYLKVIQRIGKVKSFSPWRCESLEDINSFCLEGNSNGIGFLMYDLEGLCRKQLREKGADQKKLKAMVKESAGILRTEVQLKKQKAVCEFTDSTDIREQISVLSEHCQDIFLNIFTRIIPFGVFYKKDRAVEIIRKKVGDIRLRRKMLRLLALIPEKKSLYLAQKAMNCRNVEKVMEEFAKIGVSPVTISKRANVRQIENMYEYLLT